MPRIRKVDPDRPDARAIREAADVLASGGLVAFPTETVYGLGADALSEAAVARVFAVKARPLNDPIIVHVVGPRDLDRVARDVPVRAREMAEAFWPGPLTLVVPRADVVPPIVTAGLATVAVRAPSHPVARALLAAFGRPIAAPSANEFGRTSPTTAAHVVAVLGEGVDLVLDGGACPIGVESTVVDCRSEPFRLLRPGGVPLEALGGWSVAAPDRAAAAASTEEAEGGRLAPGLLARHYAPRARVVLLAAVDPLADIPAVLASAARSLAWRGEVVGILAVDEDLAHLGAPVAGVVVRSLGTREDEAALARALFGALRELDAAGVSVVLARELGTRGLARAIRDRLERASEGRVVPVGRAPDRAAAQVVRLALTDDD